VLKSEHGYVLIWYDFVVIGGDSSDEGSSPSQHSTPTTPMANQNNPTRPWLDQDALVVPGAQHPLPKQSEKWLPKFDPD